METQLFIRIRGRILGPYDQEKLQSLAKRGQLSRMHEVSTDAANWVRASTYPELFAYQDGPPPIASQQAVRHGRITSSEDAIPPTPPDSTPFNESRSARLLLGLALCAGGVVIIALVLSVVFVISNRNADVALSSVDTSDAAPVVADDVQSPEPQQVEKDVHNNTAPVEENGNSIEEKVRPLSSPTPTVASDGKHYIASAKDHSNIKAAVGLVVVGIELRHGKRFCDIPIASGSAFAVGRDEGIMLTNKHVVQRYLDLSSDNAWKRKIRIDEGLLAAEKLWVFLGGEKYFASLQHTSPKFDLAIIQIPAAIKKPFRLKLSTSKLVDEEVRAIGFPAIAGAELSEEQLAERTARLQDKLEQGKTLDITESFLPHALECVVTRGTICQVAFDDTAGVSWMQHSAGIAPGSSGGPLILSDGTVIGINTAGIGDHKQGGAEFYRAISVGQLRSEIDRYSKQVIWIL